MIDSIEQMLWFAAYLSEAMKVAQKPITRRRAEAIRAWARSMSLIAEQFAPGDEPEEVEA